MRIWAFVSQKGGAGKTTLATHLAVYAEERGETVLLIDLDPQGSACAWHEIRGNDEPMVLAAAPGKLGELAEGARSRGVTLLLLDTAPHTDRGAVAAIRVAEIIVVPVRPSLYDIAAMRDTMKLLELTGRTADAVAVLNAIPPKGKEIAKEAAEAVKTFRLAVADTHISHRASLVAAIPKGQGITEFAPKDAGSREVRELFEELNRLAKRKARKSKVTP